MGILWVDNQQRTCLLFPQDQKNEDPMTMVHSNVGVITTIETKNLQGATGITTGDEAAEAEALRAAVFEVVVAATMTDAVEEDIIIAAEEVLIGLTMNEIEMTEVLIDEAVTTTTEMVSIIPIEEVATELDTTIIAIVEAVDLIHSEGGVMTEGQQSEIVETRLLRKPEVPLAVV